ncbi:MAG TPA: L,D-transpeptidase [Pyrinomonadaceae bacterium]|nr:L,D-transpeptidase [Pyrinomonadaceae bacterium]
MKTFIAAALVVLSLASAVSLTPAKMAGETTMPIEAHANAETKPGETFAAGGMQSPQAAPRQSPLKLPLVKPRIVVSKSKRQLLLYAGGALVRTYKIALGGNPVDDKVRQGDRATPEGDFYVCVKNARSNFHLSLGLNYPNAEDAERGLRDKLITRAEYERIMHAIRNKRRPPWDTALGGEIFIHGGGSESDWTWGCVALSNPEIEELFDAVPLGTPVRIER